jgi:competence protein ComFC
MPTSKNRLDWLWNIIFPRFCYNCGAMGEFLCDRCHSQLDFLVNPDIRDQLFQSASSNEIALDHLYALVTYDELLGKMMHAYKYKGVRDLRDIFVHWLYQYLDLGQVEVITYIPIHRRRLTERGYNQATLIAETLAQKLNVPCLPLLKRTTYRQNQALSHDKAERLAKAQGVFTLQHQICDTIKPTTAILIIDDVVTTGATISAAATLLKEFGFTRVSGAAIAHG